MTAFGLRVSAGRPVLSGGGEVLTSIYSETYPVGMHHRNRQMAESGVRVFMLLVRGDFEGDFHTSWFWRDDGVYGDESDRRDDLTLDRQAEEILRARPDALFIVRWSSEVPARWAERHPDQMQASETKRLRYSSYGSVLAAEGRAELARRIVRWCESRPWGQRVIGWAPFGQDEGTHELSIREALFDQSPAMQEAFLKHLRETYGTSEALQRAWADPTARLDSARPPTDSEWREARSRWMHWPEPRELARYRDYFLAMRRMLLFQRRNELAAVRAASTRPAFVATDAFKQPMLGWLIRDAFEAAALGPEFRNILLGSGSVGVGEMLDLPELDALVTPADYSARSVGFGFEPEGAGDSMVLRGKAILVEDDARSWTTNERTTQGAWRTPAECRAGLMRNLAVCASRGHIPYWMNVGKGYFDDPEVLAVVREQIGVRARLLSRPFVHTEHAIAMIIDDESPLDEDFTSGFQHLAVLRQRVDHLAPTGLPYRVYLFSDLARENFPRFRAYLVPNLFRLTPERARLVREKLMRDGSVVIFGPGTGISDGGSLGAEGASRLMGIPLELVRKESARRVLVHGGSHPALAGIEGPFVYGDSLAYGPILQPSGSFAESGAVELGRASAWWGSNTAGLVLREFGKGAAGNGRPGGRGSGDCAVVFSMAVPLPAALLRSLAIYGGCCAWSDLGDVVAADGGMIAIHTVRPGRRLVRLPRTCDVTDAFDGSVVARGASSFEATLGSPDTRVFLFGD